MGASLLRCGDDVVFVAGHFGEWLQGRLGPAGEIALVTLRCPVRGVRAEWAAPSHTAPSALDAEDAERRDLLWSELGCGPQAEIHLMADMPAGVGCGMSTAALVALARLAGADERRIAPACLAVEGASDPLMLAGPDSVLWAPRRAEVVRGLPVPPRATIIGATFGPPEPTDPADLAFPDMSDLVAHWSTGPDLQHCAALAAASAERTRAMRGPAEDPSPDLAARLGALGYARAHTGSARALIFPPGSAPAGADAALREAGFANPLQFETGGR